MKKRRRQKASAFTPMDMSSEGTQIVKLSDLPTIKVTKETREGSNHAGASHLDIANLLRVP